MEHVVRVFAPPLGECAGSNTWESAAKRMEARLRDRLGVAVRFETIHFFSPEFFGHPEVAELVRNGEGTPPIVTVDDQVVQTGGKLRERVIREALEGAENPLR